MKKAASLSTKKKPAQRASASHGALPAGPRVTLHAGSPVNGNGAATLALNANGPSLEAAVLLEALVAVRKGDFSARLPVTWTGLNGRIADTFNDIVDMHERFAHELE